MRGPKFIEFRCSCVHFRSLVSVKCRWGNTVLRPYHCQRLHAFQLEEYAVAVDSSLAWQTRNVLFGD